MSDRLGVLRQLVNYANDGHLRLCDAGHARHDHRSFRDHLLSLSDRVTLVLSQTATKGARNVQLSVAFGCLKQVRVSANLGPASR
jgi:hypothetical protein